MPAIRSPRILPSLALLVFALVQSGGDREPGPPLGPAIERKLGMYLRSMRLARGRCDWVQTLEEAGLVRLLAPSGSDPWLEATGAAASAHFVLGQAEARTLAAEVRAAVELLVRPGPPESSKSLDSLTPVQRLQLADAEMIEERLLQAEGQHEAALARIGTLIELLRGAGPQAADRLGLALLDAAKSLGGSGRPDEARPYLVELRDEMADTLPGAVASVLLQHDAENVALYRGMYEGDPAHEARMKAVRAAMPAARSRLAEALGRPLTDLPQNPVGFADRPRDLRHLGGVTQVDPQSGMGTRSRA